MLQSATVRSRRNDRRALTDVLDDRPVALSFGRNGWLEVVREVVERSTATTPLAVEISHGERG